MKLSSILLALPLVLLPRLASAEILSVKTSTASFREAPHQASKVKFTADQFYPVEVVEKKAGWTKTKDFEGDEAWVADKLLAPMAAVVVTADRANVREAASTASPVLFKVERGEVFKIEERSDNGWLKVVDARGDGGWIRADMTWGDPKREPAGSSSASTEPAPLVEPTKSTVDPKAVDSKAVDSKAPSNAKEAPAAKPEARMSVAELGAPENLAALCRAYLATPNRSEVLSSEKASSDKAPTEKTTPNKAAHTDKTTAPKAEKKPAAGAQKKAEKKS